MKITKILPVIFIFTTISLYAQTEVKNHYWAGSSEFIFSWGNVKIENTDVGSVLRFSGFFNYQSQFHYNFSKKTGIYTGLGVRNVGFINKLNDSIKIKQRVYSAGIPFALKLGNMEKSAYMAIGGELELFFNFKQKTFYKETKSKFNEWFSDRTELINPSVFLELKGKHGNYIRFKYYVNDFLKANQQTVLINNVVNNFYPQESKLFYISIGSTLKYKELKSKDLSERRKHNFVPLPYPVTVKTILNKTRLRDPWFLDDYTINPYSGCSFNCLYCYIRGSKYGMQMEEKLSVKINAIEVLEKQLHNRARKNQYGIIVLSSATDPYLQFEKEQLLTRQILEVILKHRFPVHIITKSDLVIRDFDLLHKINETAILPADLKDKLDQKVFVTFSFSTIDNAVAKIFEPAATLPGKRMEALKVAISHGFLSGASLMPLLPFITDTAEHLEKMFDLFKDAKAKYVFPASLTLFGNGTSDSRTLVFKAVEKHYPHLKDKYYKFFSDSIKMPAYYQEAFEKR